MKINPDDPAFPVCYETTENGLHLNEWGLTKLEDFTKVAMAAIFSNPKYNDYTLKERTVLAVDVAKAQIAELNKE